MSWLIMAYPCACTNTRRFRCRLQQTCCQLPASAAGIKLDADTIGGRLGDLDVSRDLDFAWIDERTRRQLMVGTKPDRVFVSPERVRFGTGDWPAERPLPAFLDAGHRPVLQVLNRVRA